MSPHMLKFWQGCPGRLGAGVQLLLDVPVHEVDRFSRMGRAICVHNEREPLRWQESTNM
jgi:hypothetical protein